MRKKIVIVLILVMSLVLTSCVKQKAEELIAEKVGEKILEKATGGKVDIDLDNKGEMASIETDDGKMVFGESLPWPKEAFSKIPELKRINIMNVVEVDNGSTVSVSFSGITIAEARSYIKELKTSGFKSQMDTVSKESITFSGIDMKGNTIFILYGQGEGDDDGGGNLSFTKGAEDFDPGDLFDDVDGGEDDFELEDFDKWPSGYIADLPELKGNITNILSSSMGLYVTFENMDRERVEKYIEEVKKVGFTENTMDMKSVDSIVYMGENSQGQSVNVTWESDGVSSVNLKR